MAFDEGQGERRGLTGRRKQSEAGWDSWAVMARAAKNSVGIDLTDCSRFKRVAAVRHRGRRQAGSSAPEEICFLVLSLDRTLKHRRLVRTVLTKAADDAAREDVARHLVHRLRQVRGAAPSGAAPKNKNKNKHWIQYQLCILTFSVYMCIQRIEKFLLFESMFQP